jgi:uncharacterized protein YegL
MLFALALIGCLLIISCDQSGSTDEPEPEEPVITESFIEVGAVAFGADILGTMELTGDLAGVRQFLEDQAQAEGGTALCYAVSEAAALLPDAVGTQDSDYAETYIVVFTDGKDNASSIQYAKAISTLEGAVPVSEAGVYAKAKEDLKAKQESANLKSYVVAFTPVANQPLATENSLKELVVDGEYRTFTNSSQFQLLSEAIANKVLVSAKSYTVSVIDGIYTDDEPLYLSFTVKAKPSFNGHKSQEVVGTFKAALVHGGIAEEDVPKFTVTALDQYNYIQLDGEILPVVNGDTIEIPLTGLRFVKDEVPYVISEVTVKGSDDGETYYPDEEAYTVDSVIDLGKQVGVLLVVDYSQSLNDRAFNAVKKAAGDFIETLSQVNALLEN